MRNDLESRAIYGECYTLNRKKIPEKRKITYIIYILDAKYYLSIVYLMYVSAFSYIFPTWFLHYKHLFVPKTMEFD